MKKYLAMILALVMALSLVACGDKKDDSADNSDGDTASGRVYWLNFKPEGQIFFLILNECVLSNI